MCAWSAEIDALILSGAPVTRTVTLEVRNGYQASVGGPWTAVPLLRDGWELSFRDGNPVVGTARFRVAMRDFEYLGEFDRDNPVQHGSAIRLRLTVDFPLGPEEEIPFRGMIDNKQAVDMGLLLECVDPMDRLQRRLAPVSMEAETDGPHSDVTLGHAANWDPAGTFYTYEIERVPGNAWAFVDENVADKRRQWVAGNFTVEKEVAPGTWEPVAASEYVIDEPNGLVRFHNDQGGAAAFRVEAITVYVEGTLELAYLVEKILSQPMDWDPDCADLGCGFADSQLRIALAGTFTMTEGSKAVLGIGTAFDDELAPGDRIAHNISPDDYGIVESVTDANNLVLRYDYRGGTAGPVAGYKSTLRASGVSLSNVNWQACDGTAADLYRKLREYYADTRGYKLWYDHMADLVRGDRVEIDVTGAIRLGPVRRLDTQSTLEGLCTAVAVSGIVGRAKNLATQPGVTVTPIVTGLPGWWPGIAKGGGTSWDGITYGIVDPAASQAVNDADMTHCYCAYNLFGPACESNWYDFYRLDLGAVWQLSEIHAYNIPVKNPNQFTQGISLLGAVNIGGPYLPITPETWRREMQPNEHVVFDCSAANPVRYILHQARPFKWVLSDNDRTVGIRELIVFGSQDVCVRACIQDTVDPGPAPHSEGQGGHFIGGSGNENDWIPDYYPDLVAKMTNAGHRVMLDDQGLVYTEMQALDRAYLLLDEVIRLYRAVSFAGHFDPRLRVFDTAVVRDDYRSAPSAAEDLYFLIQDIRMSETGVTVSGTEYGAGVLE